MFLGRGLCGDHYLLHKELRRYRPAIGVWCSSRAVTSNRNQVSSDRLAKTLHQMFCGRPPRPRSAFVCPLDNGGLIRVRHRWSPFGLSLVSSLLPASRLTPSGSRPAALRDIAHAVHTLSHSPSNAPRRPGGRADSVARYYANGWRFPLHTERPG